MAAIKLLGLPSCPLQHPSRVSRKINLLSFVGNISSLSRRDGRPGPRLCKGRGCVCAVLLFFCLFAADIDHLFSLVSWCLLILSGFVITTCDVHHLFPFFRRFENFLRRLYLLLSFSILVFFLITGAIRSGSQWGQKTGRWMTVARKWKGWVFISVIDVLNTDIKPDSSFYAYCRDSHTKEKKKKICRHFWCTLYC